MEKIVVILCGYIKGADVFALLLLLMSVCV